MVGGKPYDISGQPQATLPDIVICAQSVWLAIVYSATLLSRYLHMVCGWRYTVMYLERSVRRGRKVLTVLSPAHTLR